MRHPNRRHTTFVTSATRAREVQRRAVVNGCANDGEPQCDIHSVLKALRLQDSQALVVIHRKDPIG